MKTPTVNDATPVLFVERIEPCLPFWEKLGFARGIEAPEGDHLGFVSLSSGTIELMYQTFDSLKKDVPQLLDAARVGKTFLFVQVKSLAAVKVVVQGQPVYLERKSSYGAQELGVREPGGHYVTFAEFASTPE